MYRHQREEHDPLENEEKGTICMICDKSMSSEAILKRHLIQQHEVIPESGQGGSCPHCDTFKGNAREIDRHLETDHKVLLETKSFTCETVEGKHINLI